MKFLIIPFLLFVFSSCHEPGPGGDGRIEMQVKHHNTPIPGATVYIAYDKSEFPGSNTSQYDDHVVADSTGKARFTGLHKGDYYLFGTGFDEGIMLPVTGGVGVEIERRDDVITTDVPVTEDH